MSKRQAAITKMNSLGERRVPFLFVIDFEMFEPYICPLAEVSSQDILYDIEGVSNFKHSPEFATFAGIEKHPISFERYQAAFRRMQRHLARGDTYLLNLTFPTSIESPLTLRELFRLTKARYRLCFFDRFVVFSPESFVKIKNHCISSYPMKGTIDATLPDAERQILESEKELAEHTTVVDLIRNDLSMVARKIHVKRFRYVERIETQTKALLQVSSEIAGTLSKDFHRSIGSIIFTLLPAGSVTGAPKKRTVEIIRDAESCPRGFFSGVFGYFDGESLDSAVMIRFIERASQRLVFRSGGGITVLSRAEPEYQEMIDKVYVPANAH